MSLRTVMAHPKPSDRVSTVDLRNKLKDFRRRVAAGEVIPIYQYTDLIGYLASTKPSGELPGQRVQEYKTIEFRERLTAIVEELMSGDLDCAYVLYHGNQRVMGLVRRDVWENRST